MRGEGFNVSLVAVDHVNNSVDADIISSLVSCEVGFSEGQQTQLLEINCTNLTFNVFSPNLSETINLYADGPCGSSEPSLQHLEVHFLNCTCPIGFEPSNSVFKECEYICDSIN